MFPTTSREQFKLAMPNLDVTRDSWESKAPSDKFARAFISERKKLYYGGSTAEEKLPHPQHISSQIHNTKNAKNIQMAKQKVRLSSELHIDPTFQFVDRIVSDGSGRKFADASSQEVIYGNLGSNSFDSLEYFQITKQLKNPARTFLSGFPLQQHSTDSLKHMDSCDVRYASSIAGTYTPSVSLFNREKEKEVKKTSLHDSKVYCIPRSKSLSIPTELGDVSHISRHEDWDVESKIGSEKEECAGGWSLGESLQGAADSIAPSQPDTEEDENPDTIVMYILDFLITMNMMNGIWATDEDSIVLQIYFKFIYDKALRKRALTGCHSLIDECECSLHSKPNKEELMGIDESNLYEIETDEDRKNVVSRLRKKFNDEYERDNTFDAFLNLTSDSDDDDDGGYYSERLEKAGLYDTPTRQNKLHSEESLLGRFGNVEEAATTGAPGYRGPVRKGRENVEAFVEMMYKRKNLIFKYDSWHSLKGRIKKTYSHCKPNWNASGC